MNITQSGDDSGNIMGEEGWSSAEHEKQLLILVGRLDFELLGHAF